MSDLPSAEIDLVRFGYVVRARLDEMDLSFDQASRLTGLSKRQLSYACNGKPICAGATHVLAALTDIDLDEMLPVVTQERLRRIRRLRKQYQAVTPPDTRETAEAMS